MKRHFQINLCRTFIPQRPGESIDQHTRTQIGNTFLFQKVTRNIKNPKRLSNLLICEGMPICKRPFSKSVNTLLVRGYKRNLRHKLFKRLGYHFNFYERSISIHSSTRMVLSILGL